MLGSFDELEWQPEQERGTAFDRPEVTARPHAGHWCGLVTDPTLATDCFALRAAEYGRMYRNIPAGQFADDLDARTLAGGDPATRLLAVLEGGVVGTCRLTLSLHPWHPEVSSEVAALTDLEWPALAAYAGVPVDALVVGELGKFAVSRDVDVRRVKWKLLTAAGAAAQAWGMHAVVALMPPLVEKAARHANVAFRPFPSARLRRDSPQALRQLLRYSDYFLPRLRRAMPGVDLEQLAELPPAELALALEGIPDGPRLWWIPPTDLAGAPDPGPCA